MTSRWWLVVVALVATLFLPGCSEPEFPRDPEGTLVRAMGGELRVGVSPNQPYTDRETEIISAWAESIDAEIVWSEGAESVLMEELKLGELDVVVGGLTAESPWTTHAALTRPYAETTGPDGKKEKLVMAVRMGENALQSSLERFLIEEGLQP